MATLRISKKARKATSPRRATKKAAAKKATKKATKKARTATKRRPTLAAASSPKERVDSIIATIREQVGETHLSAHRIGQMLVELRKPEIWELYAETSFKDFLNEHVLPHSTALRFIKFAQSYSETIAGEIGLERGIQLARLAKEKQLGNPQTLWTRNAVLQQTPRKRAKQLSAADIERLTKAAMLQKAKANLPEPTDEEEAAVNRLKKRFTKALGLDADFGVDVKKRKVRIELDLDDLLPTS